MNRTLKTRSGLTDLENGIKSGINLLLFPLSLTRIRGIPENHIVVTKTFGKFDGYRLPGIAWIGIPSNGISVYLGDKVSNQNNMNIIDKEGNPLIVRTSVVYKIVDPIAYLINVNNEKIIDTFFESKIRCMISTYSYDDIIVNSKNIMEEYSQVNNSSEKLKEYGVEIEYCNLSDIKYSPEIAKSMLIKQQTTALINARANMVDNVVNIVKDFNSRIVNMDEKERSKLSSYLIMSMMSDSSIQPVYDITS